MNQDWSNATLPSSSGPSGPRASSPSTPTDGTSIADERLSATERAGSKRKRLTKACDACHRSKRRCDGTAPCSNCYFASKPCTYTDNLGRPVPAPKIAAADPPEPSSSSRSLDRSMSLGDIPALQHTVGAWDQPSVLSSQDDQLPRKRLRASASATSVGYPVDYSALQVSIERAPPLALNNTLMRELVSLFFTHCHPARIVFHKPTFTAALTHGIVPAYLTFSICALAAPLSKQPHLRMTPARLAGRPFAQEALSLMFDGAGRLTCEPSLATAQALCLLQIHNAVAGAAAAWNKRQHDLTFQVCDRLGVHSNDEPQYSTLGPTSAYIEGAINKESLRRIYWLIYFMDVTSSVYVRAPLDWMTANPRLRLPCDETSFELAVGKSEAEYLYLPAPQTESASEMGHLIRVAAIWAELELALEEIDSSNPEESLTRIRDLELRFNAWETTLSPQLRFSDDVLAVQQSMLETGSNNGAWCWALMHVYRASCALVLCEARERDATRQAGADLLSEMHPAWSERQAISVRDPRRENEDEVAFNWPVGMLEAILHTFGNRAKNSTLLFATLWPLIKYCKREDAEIHARAREAEELWGACIPEFIRNWTVSSEAATHTTESDSLADRLGLRAERPGDHSDHAGVPQSLASPSSRSTSSAGITQWQSGISVPISVNAAALESFASPDTLETGFARSPMESRTPRPLELQDPYAPGAQYSRAHSGFRHTPLSRGPKSPLLPSSSPRLARPRSPMEASLSMATMTLQPQRVSSPLWRPGRSMSYDDRNVPSLPRGGNRHDDYSVPYDEEGTPYHEPVSPYLQQRRFDPYHDFGALHREQAVPHPPGPRLSLPSLKASGLLSEAWENDSAMRHMGGFMRNDEDFASNMPRHGVQLAAFGAQSGLGRSSTGTLLPESSHLSGSALALVSRGSDGAGPSSLSRTYPSRTTHPAPRSTRPPSSPHANAPAGMSWLARERPPSS